MKIDQSVKKSAGLPVNGSKAQPGKTVEEKKTEKASGSGDSVTLSPKAQAMSQSADKAPFDVDKIKEIMAAMSNGTFKVNANNIADGLIDTVKDLVSTRKS